MRFVDEVEIVCISGDGGQGCSSFRKEKYIPYGGPDGGDGGKGGDIVLCATSRRNTLEYMRFQHTWQAEHGTPGGARNRHGGWGADREIEVPVGTVVIDRESELQVADLSEDGARVVLCRGGRGGRGNARFKSATNRTPTRHDPGRPGQRMEVRLELKLLADVGLLGFPNAGKSTLISTVSNARPRVADYPFTTLVPKLGVVKRGFDGSFVIADIPGLVEGAAEGVGLGHRFLKHVERCSLFLHLVNASDYGEPVSDPVQRYRAINLELARFSEELAQRRQVAVLSRADLLDEEALAALVQRFEEETGERPMVLSAATGQGVEALMQRCWELLHPVGEE